MSTQSPTTGTSLSTEASAKAKSLITDHLPTWTSAIKTKSGAGRGSSKKRELYGIKKLRELILELAVRGLLVPQDPKDEPASELLKRITKIKAELVKKGKIKKKKKKIPQRLKLETLEGFPGGWTTTQLIDIAQVEMGNSPPGSTYNDDQVGVPLINGPVEFSKGHFGKTIKSKFTTAPNIMCDEGDILVCVRGATTGRTNIADFDACIGRGVARVKAFEYQDFINLLMWENQHRLLAKGTGTTFPSISYQDLACHQILLPPLAEQRRIVAKVDELMRLCDRLERETETQLDTHLTLVETLLAALTDATSPPAQFAQAWQRIAAHFDTLFTTESSIDHLKQTILQLAVMGKLVEQDPTDEPASELLKKIATSLESTKGKKSKNVLTSNQEPFATPRGWAWATFPQLGEFGRGKSKHRPRNDPSLYSGGTHKMIQTGDVARSNGTINTHTALYNDIGLAQSRKWPKETLCITIAANIADSGILEFDACFPDSVVGFIPSTKLPSVRYFEYFLRTAKEHLMSFAPATAQKNINLGILEQVRIPLPPAAEQRRIVAKVDELMSLCDALKAKLQAAQTTQLHLTDTLASTAIP